MSNNPLEELVNLRQTGTVEEYQCQFQSLLARTTDLKPPQQVNLFIIGLLEELRIDIEMQQPGNLRVAMNMTRALERKQKVSFKILSQTNLNWSASQNAGSTSIIPKTKSSAKGGGQTTKPMGNNSKIEVPDIEVEQDDEVDDLEISLHAIRGTWNSSTIQLTAKVSGKTVLVLVNSGSTHNFLREGLVPRLGLKIQKKIWATSMCGKWRTGS
ncbi:hypothetical protein GOBAR_AA08225 [Gossypium barbadense]|uniref:Retrotransposon gag domain-containing protein n=1 Tax=Gossypium barbadense TaxID=3634 RepID=A0A2P5Y9Z1_GOSBA|nr:hypothetical protein GOBAR_AA08225 [Gossypium barbadense]